MFPFKVAVGHFILIISAVKFNEAATVGKNSEFVLNLQTLNYNRFQFVAKYFVIYHILCFRNASFDITDIVENLHILQNSHSLAYAKLVVPCIEVKRYIFCRTI